MIRFLLPILSLAGCNAALRVKVAGNEALPIPETPPAVTLQLTNAEAVMSDADLTVAWTVDGWDASALKYDVSLASTAACADSVATLGVTGSTQTTFANIWEGTHYLCVKTQVGDKTFDAGNNGVKVVVDRAAPTTSGLSLSLVSRTTNLVEVSWPNPTDAGTKPEELKYYVYVTTDANLTTMEDLAQAKLLNPDGNQDPSSFTVEGLVEASTYYVHVLVKDLAGHASLFDKYQVRTKVRSASDFIALYGNAKFHFCALSSDRRAYCWGKNSNGQIGTGTSGGIVHSPTEVQGGHRFLELGTGDAHTCGLTVEGKVYCWGSDSVHQLGNGAVQTTDQAAPVAIDSALTFKQLAVGWNHACAIDSLNDLYCWGSDLYGQLGNDAGSHQASPAQITSPVFKARAVSAGGNQTCMLASDGQGYCWGHGGYGRLGNGDELNKQVPTPIVTSVKFRHLRMGMDTACGISDEGKLYCWGRANRGLLGTNEDGDLYNKSVPTAVHSTETFRSLAFGTYASCAITTAGASYCWGSNDSGQLGLSGAQNRTVPTRLEHPHTFVQLVMGWGTTCGLTSLGKTYCWGSDANGELGNGPDLTSEHISPSPVDMTNVTGGIRLTSLAAGANTCGITSQHNVYCAGSPTLGRLGGGPTLPTTNVNVLTPVATDQKFLSISSAWHHTCGLTVYGKAYCWGNNLQGQIGNDAMGSHAYWPTPVAFDGTFIAIGTGRQSSCGLTGDGKIYCWGGDTADISGGPFKGMLGDGGTAEDKAVPIAIDSALRFVGLTVGWDHVCGQTQSGASSCWGRNNLGAFGNATTANDNFSPVPVAHALNFLSFAGGESHTCGLADDGEAYCWGGGLGGSLGTGNQTHRSSPTLLDASAPSLRSMAAGYRYSCGIAMDGSGFCWGQDLFGRIGVNGVVNANVLAPTALASSDKLTMISAGYNHTCALTAANDAMCWGRGTDGQLAAGTGITSLSAPPSTYISVEQ